ncbi:MAG: hypothetical protein IJU40_08210 [Desulfovibrionaceae bacterium]|nr:hypothetical protein [Desulfovibrionaceae bacterium]
MPQFLSKDKVLSEQKALRALSRARANLVLNHPFFGSLALRLNLAPDYKCMDVWSDGVDLGFNPAWVAVQSEKCLEAALAHEMLHLACGHHVRRKKRDLKLWNEACDLAVNLILQDTGFKLPRNFKVDSQYKDLSADEIFALLSQVDSMDSHGGAQKLGPKKGSSTQSQGMGQSSLGFKGSKSEEQKSQSGSSKSDSKATKGLGQESLKDAETKKESVGDFVGEVRDHPLLNTPKIDSQAEQKAQREAEIALVMAMQRALHAGDMPAHFQRFLRARIRPKLDWRELLQRFIEIRIDNDSTWTKPNRRYLYQGLYLPSRNEPNIKKIVLAVDSSGSIDDQKLTMFCTELSNILSAFDTTLIVIYHDSEVKGHQIVSRLDLPLNLTPKGGGTDYRPIARWIEDEYLDPVCLLWFTDLQCSHFPKEPNYPVLWISTDKSPLPPPFGELIYID